MRLTALAIVLALLSACSAHRAPTADRATSVAPATPASEVARVAQEVNDGKGTAGKFVKDSTTVQASTVQYERKIIRNGELDLESDNTKNSYTKIASIAEKHGGFVVTSESSALGDAGETYNIILRVPAAKFDQTLQEIRAVGTRVVREKISGIDVTEEFYDLEARLRAKRALEEQFLEIMKRATKVSDALEVQTQITEVRTEIEQMEGRRRYLENQAALSTVTINLHPPARVMVSGSSFTHKLRDAFSDSRELMEELILFGVRITGVVFPLVAVALPIGLYIRRVRRRRTNKTQ